MAKQIDLDKAYMKCAYNMAALSTAVRKQVGAIIVQPNGGIIAEGYNGTPSGFDNCCEDTTVLEYHLIGREKNVPDKYVCSNCDKTWGFGSGFDIDRISREEPCEVKLTTKPEVLHAESNAVTKVACSSNSSKGGTMYITCSPCIQCAKLIIQARIIRVVYHELYRDDEGIQLLRRAGIMVDQLCNGTEL